LKIKSLFVAVMALLFISCSDNTFLPTTQLTKAEVYFPLHVGDEWRYFRVSGVNMGDSSLITCSGLEKIADKMYFKVGKSYYRTEGDYVYSYSEGKENLVINFSTAVADTSKPFAKYVYKTGDDSVAAGSFMKCISATSLSTSWDGGTFDDYAPNIGLIRQTGFKWRDELTYARINGKVYGKK
jgi:hypothetical protein